MFFEQSILGILICGLIVILSGAYVLMAFKVKKFYSIAVSDINIRKSGNGLGKSELVSNTLEDFDKCVKKGLRSINSVALIEEHIPEWVSMMRSYMKYIISTVIVLGLLGTFLGLTGSIGSIKGVIDSLVNDNSNIDEFLGNIAMPLSAMSTAFFTSITGILSSVILRIIGISTYIAMEDKYYKLMENYLDNIVSAQKDKDSEKLLSNLTRNINTAMRNLCDNVSSTFERSLQSFNMPVTEFKNSIDGLRTSNKDSEKAIRELGLYIDKYKNNLETKRLNKFMDDMYRTIGDKDGKR